MTDSPQRARAAGGGVGAGEHLLNERLIQVAQHTVLREEPRGRLRSRGVLHDPAEVAIAGLPAACYGARRRMAR